MPIEEVAARAGIDGKHLELYGKYKAKVSPEAASHNGRAAGKLILVTAISPTPAGEGKTTTTVGLGDALSMLGKRCMIALREPSLGPVFGVKGGAAGGGYAQVVPMEDINLHFTGDLHAVGAANNLLAALLDNHIYQGNALGIDPKTIVLKRCIDMNDRQLRVIASGQGGKTGGVPRDDGFDITVASEVMAALCLCDGISDLKNRLGKIIVAYDAGGQAVTAARLRAAGAMAALLKDAVKPNLVQTLGGTPALIHGGPFANIAHGCNSLAATRLALQSADYTVTEAGFGADLGAEKFMDIKCRAGGLRPSAVVIVATVRALKMHGGADKSELKREDIEAVKRGLPNLLRHIRNLREVFGLEPVVALNKFPSDGRAELDAVREACAGVGADCALSEVYGMGGAGGLELAAKVIAASEKPNRFRYAYPDSLPIREKVQTLARDIYGADGADFTPEAEAQLLKYSEFDALPVCMAKTQYSFSDNPAALGAPQGFRITVRRLKVCAGAGFVVAFTGDVLTMPGLPAAPAAEGIDIDAQGNITGLF
ncbi:MAG: formate--tetrahydrofolate ligase [Firmicutes bacterium]|nr:formate--tetrahydrofolate ligase [Bacillota bacterium]